MAYERKPKRGPTPGFIRSKAEEKELTPTGLGITPKGARKTKLAFGVTPTDVEQAKKKRTRTESQRRYAASQRGKAASQRGKAAQQVADVEKGVSQAVRKRETGTAKPWTPKPSQWMTRLKKLLASMNLPKGVGGTAAEIAQNIDSPAKSDKFEQLITKIEKLSNNKGGTVSRKKGGNIMKSRKGGGTVKKQVGGLPVGYDARLRESLAARHPAVTGNLAARAAESRGMERALGRRPFAAVGTMDRPVKKGGSVRRKKGGTTSRKSGGKIMQGYKAGGKV